MRLNTPKGTKDILPKEVKEYQFIENRLRRSFILWDYEEVRSPTIEFVKTLSTGVGSELTDSMFKFQDFDGKLLALRAEMTAPVARIVTTRMESIPEPIRLFYINNVFRYNQSYLNREREFYQAGVELVGCNSSEADGEILALIISSLKKVGLNNVRIDLGHANLLKGLLNATNLKKKQKASVQNLLACRDVVGLKNLMEQNSFPSNLREAFLDLSNCRRLDQIPSISLYDSKYKTINNQIENLWQLQKILKNYEIEKYVFFDFSLTRKIEYYTGMIFEVSVPNLGLPIGSGGRYDNFIEKFGPLKLPSTGFALEIGGIIEALKDQGFKIPDKNSPKFIVTSKFKKSAINAVKTLRNAGLIASIEITERSIEKTIENAKITNVNYVISVGSSINSPTTIFNIENDTKTTSKLTIFLKNLGG